jgi:YbbR domain-containing protein
MKLITNNPQLKLVSLLVACLLWLSVTTNVRTVELLVPYEVRGVPQNRVLTSSFKEKVKVRITGPAFIVDNVEDSYPVFEVKIPPGLQQDRYIAKFSKDDLLLSSALKVLSIQPKQVELIFDTRIKKEVSVEVPRLGTLDPDFTLASLSVEPSRVILEGPSAQLRDIELVETYPLQLKDLTGPNAQLTTSQLLGLRFDSTLIDATVTTVTAKVVVQPVVVTESITGVPLKLVGGESMAVQYDTPTITVRMSGGRKLLREITPKNIHATINVPQQQGEFEVIPSVIIAEQNAEDFTVLGTEPSHVRIVVAGKKKQIK